MINVDIAIVGGGITGASLAALLDDIGLTSQCSVALIDLADVEAAVDLSEFDPRVVALSSASQEILTQANVWQALTKLRACAYQSMYVWDAEGTGNIRFSADDIQQTNLGHIVENKVLVHVLNQRLAGIHNLIQLRGAGLEQIHADCGYQRLLLSNAEQVRAQLVIGADGAKSKVRELAHFETKAWAYGQKAIVTTVETQHSHAFCAWQRFSPVGPLAFLPLSRSGQDDKTSSIVWSLDDDIADQNMALSDDDFKVALAEALEWRLGDIHELDRRVAIPLRQSFATRYCQPGVVLVGDAAHAIHPLAGQGVNMGLYDVAALAEELGRAQQRGLALNEMATLRRYERVRQPHNLMAMAVMEMFKRGFGNDALLLRYLRNTGMSLANKQYPLKRFFARMAAGA